jgi:uncharacterized coiled-coil protein SlyX
MNNGQKRCERPRCVTYTINNEKYCTTHVGWDNKKKEIADRAKLRHEDLILAKEEASIIQAADTELLVNEELEKLRKRRVYIQSPEFIAEHIKKRRAYATEHAMEEFTKGPTSNELMDTLTKQNDQLFLQNDQIAQRDKQLAQQQAQIDMLMKLLGAKSAPIPAPISTTNSPPVSVNVPPLRPQTSEDIAAIILGLPTPPNDSAPLATTTTNVVDMTDLKDNVENEEEVNVTDSDEETQEAIAMSLFGKEDNTPKEVRKFKRLSLGARIKKRFSRPSPKRASR